MFEHFISRLIALSFSRVHASSVYLEPIMLRVYAKPLHHLKKQDTLLNTGKKDAVGLRESITGK